MQFTKLGNPPSKRISTTQGNCDKQSLEAQLAAALLQIAVLRDQNSSLIQRVKKLEYLQLAYEHHEQSLQLLREQLTFRRDQQNSMQTIIHNYEQINSQLTSKLHNLQQHFKLKSLPTTAEPTPEADSFDAQNVPQTQRFRASYRGRSESTDRRENHALTPKSRVRFDMRMMLEEDGLGKKKVLFC